MNRFVSTALVASFTLAASAAMAQSTQDKTAVKPGKEQIQTQQQDPSIKAMDDNTQRQHSRDQSKGATSGTTTPAPTAGSATTSMSDKQAAAPQAGTTRDWAMIDANHDNLISPEEMEAALKAGGSQPAKPAVTK